MRLPVLSWLLCVLALVGLLAWLGHGVVDATPKARADHALIGGPFTLTDGSGATVTDATYRGTYMLIYFGFTHCPDLCPTTLLLVSNALERLGDQGKHIVPIFVTLDPERDTPQVVGDYVMHFNPRLVGLTGTQEQIKTIADAYKIYYSKVEQPDSAMGYVIDHSGFLYLMGPDGQYITHFPHDISEQALVKTLKEKVNP